MLWAHPVVCVRQQVVGMATFLLDPGCYGIAKALQLLMLPGGGSEPERRIVAGAGKPASRTAGIVRADWVGQRNAIDAGSARIFDFSCRRKNGASGTLVSSGPHAVRGFVDGIVGSNPVLGTSVAAAAGVGTGRNEQMPELRGAGWADNCAVAG